MSKARYNIIMVLSLLIITSALHAKPLQRTTPANISNLTVVQQNDSLFISFDVSLEKNDLKSNESLQLIPIIRGQNCVIELPGILVQGTKRASYYKRERNFQNYSEYSRTTPLITFTAKEKKIKTQYLYTIPITESIDGANLFVDSYLYTCCDGWLEKGEELLSERIRFVAPQPPRPTMVPAARVTYLEAPKEETKKRSSMLRSYINFHVDKYDVIPELGNNSYELSRIDSVLDPMLKNKDIYKLQYITIDGFASPEATWKHNYKLAYNRANNFWSFLSHKYQLTFMGKDMVTITSNSEDWKGLVTLIEQEDMPYKQSVLDVINENSDPDIRERRVRAISKGAAWKYMLKNYFHLLRRMEITVDYEVGYLSDRDALDIFEKRPMDLGLEEMYRVCTLKGMSKEQAYLFSMNYFADNPIAIINASSVKLTEGDVDAAERYLSAVKNNTLAFNNIAIFYLLKEDYTKATSYFEKARNSGDKLAQTNLDNLDKYIKALQQWENSKGNYIYRTR